MKEVTLTRQDLAAMSKDERKRCMIEIAEVQHLLRNPEREEIKIRDRALSLAAEAVCCVPTEWEIQAHIEDARRIVTKESEVADWSFASDLLTKDIYRRPQGTVPIFVREEFVVPKRRRDNVFSIETRQRREGEQPALPQPIVEIHKRAVNL